MSLQGGRKLRQIQPTSTSQFAVPIPQGSPFPIGRRLAPAPSRTVTADRWRLSRSVGFLGVPTSGGHPFCPQVVAMAAVVLALASCKPAPVAPNRCVSGATVACACLGGVSWVQTCLPNGTFGTCTCVAPVAVVAAVAAPTSPAPRACNWTGTWTGHGPSSSSVTTRVTITSAAASGCGLASYDSPSSPACRGSLQQCLFGDASVSARFVCRFPDGSSLPVRVELSRCDGDVARLRVFNILGFYNGRPVRARRTQ